MGRAIRWMAAATLALTAGCALETEEVATVVRATSASGWGIEEERVMALIDFAPLSEEEVEIRPVSEGGALLAAVLRGEGSADEAVRLLQEKAEEELRREPAVKLSAEQTAPVPPAQAIRRREATWDDGPRQVKAAERPQSAGPDVLPNSGSAGKATTVEGPQVQVAAAGSGGSADSAPDVSAVVEAGLGQVRYCHAASSARAGIDLHGRIEMSWDIVGGRATNITVVDNTMDSISVQKCIEARLRTWDFGSTTQSGVSWPFIFRQ